MPEKDAKKPKKVEKAPIHIYRKWCKNCGICVAFCPVGVFAMKKDGTVIAAHPEKCTHCGLCAILCPDFALSGVEDIKKHPIDLSEFISP